MRLSVIHSTRYRYHTLVSRSTQYIRLTPCTVPQQRIVQWRVELPRPCVTMRDAFDNLTHVLTLDQPHEEIRMVARGTVEVPDVDDGEPAGRINPKVFLRSTPLTAPDEAIRGFVEPMRATVRARPLIGVSDLMSAVLDRLPYRRGLTSAETTAAQAFAAGGGVSQDQPHGRRGIEYAGQGHQRSRSARIRSSGVGSALRAGVIGPRRDRRSSTCRRRSRGASPAMACRSARACWLRLRLWVWARINCRFHACVVHA